MHYTMLVYKPYIMFLLSILSCSAVNSADGDAGAYKAATGVSLTIAIVMFSALILVIISVYFWHKQRGIGEEVFFQWNPHSMHSIKQSESISHSTGWN